MNAARDRAGRAWAAAGWVGLPVLAANLVLVAIAGTDIPSFDQWDADGRWLLPKWESDDFAWSDLFRLHNEHRIVWTRWLTLLLFVVNGQWDPLVELVTGAGLRAAAAASVAWWFVWSGAGVGFTVRWTLLAFLSPIAWHNVLWSFQTQVFFSVVFGVAAVGLLTTGEASVRRSMAGMAVGLAALLAMGPSALLPAGLIGVALLRSWESRRLERMRIGAAILLAVAGWLLRGSVPEHAALKAESLAEFFVAFGRTAGWPHTAQPVAALVMNLPLAWIVMRRIWRRDTRPSGSQDFALGLGGWALAIAAGAAWMRGGSDEWLFGVPSRYADFLALQLVANAWCLAELVRGAGVASARPARLLGVAWAAFAFIGVAGLSAEAIRRVIVPRARDREAPVRLAVELQRTRDPAVFEGRWRAILPHPDVRAVQAVLDDSRMAGKLPPSLQPSHAMGPLSKATRAILGRD